MKLPAIKEEEEDLVFLLFAHSVEVAAFAWSKKEPVSSQRLVADRQAGLVLGHIGLSS